MSHSLREEMAWPTYDLFEGSCSRCLLNLEVQTTGVECRRHYTSLRNPICNSCPIPPSHAGYFFQATPKEKPVIVLILTNWRQSGHKHPPLCLFPLYQDWAGLQRACWRAAGVGPTGEELQLQRLLSLSPVWNAEWNNGKGLCCPWEHFLLWSQAKDLSVKWEILLCLYFSTIWRNFIWPVQ